MLLLSREWFVFTLRSGNIMYCKRCKMAFMAKTRKALLKHWDICCYPEDPPKAKRIKLLKKYRE